MRKFKFVFGALAISLLGLAAPLFSQATTFANPDSNNCVWDSAKGAYRCYNPDNDTTYYVYPPSESYSYDYSSPYYGYDYSYPSYGYGGYGYYWRGGRGYHHHGGGGHHGGGHHGGGHHH